MEIVSNLCHPVIRRTPRCSELNPSSAIDAAAFCLDDSGAVGGKMQRVLSTYRYINQPLAPGLLADISNSAIRSIEVFCASGHFDYRSPQAVKRSTKPTR